MSLSTNKSRCIVLRLRFNKSDKYLVFTATLFFIVLYITICLSDSCSATFTATFANKLGCTRQSSVGWRLNLKHTHIALNHLTILGFDAVETHRTITLGKF